MRKLWNFVKHVVGVACVIAAITLGVQAGMDIEQRISHPSRQIIILPPVINSQNI